MSKDISNAEKKKAVINIRDLRKTYVMGSEEVHALDGVNLEIFAGEFAMIVGSSGSGKSTMMHILGLLDRPTSGELSIGDSESSGLNDAELSQMRNRHVGFIFQQFNLLNELTVLENIALPLAYAGLSRSERLERAKIYAEKMGLGHRLDHRPNELSGGQNQRVAIARALVSEPDIIMADEPTGALDSHTGHEIMKILHDLNSEGRTIIMVTHDNELASEGTRRITMRDGQIIEDKRLQPPAEAPTDHGEGKNHGTISFNDLIHTGIREGLWPHKLRSFLTALGIIIGVSSVIAMSSFSLGSRKKQADQIRALGSNLITFSNLVQDKEEVYETRISGSQGLSLQDLKYLKANFKEIDAAAGVRHSTASVAINHLTVNARVRGISNGYLRINNLNLDAGGRSVSPADQHLKTRVAIIGSSLASKFKGEALGQQLRIGENYFTVIGILKNQNVNLKGLEATGLRDSGQDVLVPLNTLLLRHSGDLLRPQLDELHLQLRDEKALVTSGAPIRRALSTLHSGNEDFEMVVPMDLMRQKEQSEKLLNILTTIISCISMIVGGIGIMNIMLAAVNERIREIGIRRATGASKPDIMIQFLSESTLLAGGGGLLGVALAGVIVLVTCHFTGLPVVFSPMIVVVSLVSSTATGLIFGLYPARNAANLNPVEALRGQ